MLKLQLTDLKLRSLRSGMYWDTMVPAFGIRVQKHRRTFLVTIGRQRKRIPFGHWPQTKLADARTNARRILYTDEQSATSSLSMRVAVDKYLDTVRLSPRWEKEQRRLVTKHFLVKHGTRDIADAAPSTSSTSPMHWPVGAGRSRRTTGRSSTACTSSCARAAPGAICPSATGRTRRSTTASTDGGWPASGTCRWMSS